MVRWLRWHCPPDTGFEIRALAVWGRARYLSVTEAPHNTDFHTWMGKKHFCFFQTAETGSRTPNSGVKGSDANHYPRAPALSYKEPYSNYQDTFSFLRINSVIIIRFEYWWIVIRDYNRLLAQVCAVHNCLIKTVQSCSLCGVLSLISV